jgi:uncharacterized protein YdaU (DUF1376 family)
MSKLPSMKFYVDAYMADTTHLTLEEHGAYLLLLMNMWRRNGALASDDAMLARMLGLQPRAWHRLKPRLWPLLTEYGPEGAKMVSQKRLQVEWNKAVENLLRQSQKGKAGAKARYEKDQALRPGRGYGTGITGKWPTITNKKEDRIDNVTGGLDTASLETGLCHRVRKKRARIRPNPTIEPGSEPCLAAENPAYAQGRAMSVVSSFVERCMRMRLTDQDRVRIQLRSRVKVDELIARYPSWEAQMAASAEQLAQAQRQWALLRAQKAERLKAQAVER